MQRSDSFSSTGLGDATALTYLGTRAHFSFYSSLLAFAEAVGNKHALKTQLKDFFLQHVADGLGSGWQRFKGGWGRGSQKIAGRLKQKMKTHLGTQPISSCTLKQGAEM